MWTLIVLLVGYTPPRGVIIYGFETYDACMAEGREYYGEKMFRYKCERLQEL